MKMFEKNPKVDLELRINGTDEIKFFQDLGQVKEMVRVLEYIDQPLNTRLSSILQLCCQYGNDSDVVYWLLEHGANPNYLDIDCQDASYYADKNTDLVAGLLCQCALMEYKSKCPVGNIFERKKLSFDIIKAEIAKHKEEIVNGRK